MHVDRIVGIALVGFLVLLVAAIAWARGRSRRALAAQEAFIRAYAFPSELRRRINHQHPDWTFAQIDRVLDGLRQYFLACLRAQLGRPLARSLGMPSRAVDDAWHAFIVMTRDYADFCKRAFGRYLHHTPEAQMQVPMRDALANTLHFSRGGAPAAGLLAAGAAAGAGMPLLFMLDRELGLADGHLYAADDISQLERHRRMLLASHDGGVDVSGAGHSGSASCDAGSSGSSCDAGGGSSCGGGGGGCGGGGCGSS